MKLQIKTSTGMFYFDKKSEFVYVQSAILYIISTKQMLTIKDLNFCSYTT